MDIAAMITKLFVKNGMIFGFMLLGVIMYVSFKLGALTKGRVHGSHFPGACPRIHWR